MAVSAPTNSGPPSNTSPEKSKQVQPLSGTEKITDTAGKTLSAIGFNYFSQKSRKNFQDLGTTFIDKKGSIYTKKVTWLGRAKQVGTVGLALFAYFGVPAIMYFVVYPALALSLTTLLTTPIGIAILITSALLFFLIKKCVLDKVLLKEPKKDLPEAHEGIMLSIISSSSTFPSKNNPNGVQGQISPPSPEDRSIDSDYAKFEMRSAQLHPAFSL